MVKFFKSFAPITDKKVDSKPKSGLNKNIKLPEGVLTPDQLLEKFKKDLKGASKPVSQAEPKVLPADDYDKKFFFDGIFTP
jgi:hypothetical protein